MECPVCKQCDHNELDLHSDGYAKDIIECSECGTIWVDDNGLANIIKQPGVQPSCTLAR